MLLSLLLQVLLAGHTAADQPDTAVGAVQLIRRLRLAPGEAHVLAAVVPARNCEVAVQSELL